MGLAPYWLDTATVVRNDITLQGQWFLTAPNMAGKSTLMRSITAAALLANCGVSLPLCDP